MFLSSDDPMINLITNKIIFLSQKWLFNKEYLVLAKNGWVKRILVLTMSFWVKKILNLVYSGWFQTILKGLPRNDYVPK